MGHLPSLSARESGKGVVAGVTVTVTVLQFTFRPEDPSLLALLLGKGVSVLVICLLIAATWWLWQGDFGGQEVFHVAGATVLGFLLGLFVSTGAMVYQEVTTPAIDVWGLTNQGFVVLLIGSIGSLIGLVAGVNGVHDRRQYERKLEQHRERRREVERLEHLASILAHDIRNPLTVAKGRLEMANETGESQHYTAVRGALDRIDSIISESVVLAQEGRDRNRLQPTSLADVAREAWGMISTDRVDLIIEEDWTIEADPNSLRHVFENLFKNAIRHGGQTLSEIRVGRTASEFYVEDDGIGLERSYSQDIFSPGMTTQPDGTGLGLTIVQTIGESHDWTVSASSGTDGGARFEFENVRFAQPEP